MVNYAFKKKIKKRQAVTQAIAIVITFFLSTKRMYLLTLFQGLEGGEEGLEQDNTSSNRVKQIAGVQTVFWDYIVGYW